MVRYLRRDDPNEKTVRRELLKTDVISNDLIPLLKILKTGKKDAELFDLTLRLLVNLTQSALNCFELKIPEDKLQYNIFIEIDNYLKKTKEPFTDEKFCQVLCDKLKEIVEKNWEDREEEEEMIAERILYLIRNMLQMKPCDEDTANRLETDINAHDMMILSLHKVKLFFAHDKTGKGSNTNWFSH